jgi:hypothetical protein
MLILDTTSKTITAVMSGAPATNQPSYVAAWADNNGTVFTEGASDGLLNGTTAVTIVASPAASTRRVIKSIYIQNTDTAAVTITIGFFNGTSTRTIAKVTLSPNDTWTTEGTFDSTGQVKYAVVQTVPFSVTTGTGLSGGSFNGSAARTFAIDSTVATLTDTQTLTNKTLTAPTISTISNSGTLTLPTGPEIIVARDTTDTLTNKRINPRITPFTAISTYAPDISTTDIVVVTAQSTTMAFDPPVGAPVNGNKLTFRIKDNNTSRNLSFSSSAGGYRAVGVTVPIATVAGKTLYIGCIYNSTDNLWDIVAIAQQA